MDLGSKKKHFEDVYEQMADKIFRFVLLRVSNREEAVDLVEEVFYKFWQTIISGGQLHSEPAFLFAIARNKVIDWYRKKKPVSLDQMIDSALDEEREPFQLVDVEACNNMKISTEAKFVVMSLQKIAPQYREILQMRFVDDLSIKEMAQILGVTENAVSLRLNHGLHKLREKLGINIKKDE
jgi:RNA polymerase sigma-70 factor (ECF subfamily)